MWLVTVGRSIVAVLSSLGLVQLETWYNNLTGDPADEQDKAFSWTLLFGLLGGFLILSIIYKNFKK